MSEHNACGEFELLLQADIDGELDAAQAAAVTAHRHQCMRCMATYKELLALRQQARDISAVTAPDAFRARLEDALRASRQAAQRPITPPPADAIRAGTTPSGRPATPVEHRLWRDLGALAAGALLATCLSLVLVPIHQRGRLQDELLADHIRAMQPGHLLDVVSTDQHNVKPWFEGKVDYAPPVKNLADQNFPLVGGRLDYVSGRTVAVTVFQRGKHPINLYAWPEAAADSDVQSVSRDGFNILNWHQGDMAVWVVSDLNPAELRQFAQLWRGR